MEKYTNIERYALIFILMQVMEADSVIHEQEIAFLNRIFIQFEITEQEISIISNLDLQQCESIIMEMESSKKKEAVALFKEMASCDGYIDPRELKIIDHLCSI